MYHIYVPRGLELFIHHNVFFSTFGSYIHVSLILSRFRRSFKIKSFISCDSDVNRIPRVIPSYIYRCYVHVLLFLHCYLRKFFSHIYAGELVYYDLPSVCKHSDKSTWICTRVYIFSAYMYKMCTCHCTDGNLYVCMQYLVSASRYSRGERVLKIHL